MVPAPTLPHLIFLQELTDLSVDELDARLNLTDDAIQLSHRTHLPLGMPQINTRDVSACVLTQTGYVSGYSHSHHIPLWSAFTIEKQVSGFALFTTVRLVAPNHVT